MRKIGFAFLFAILLSVPLTYSQTAQTSAAQTDTIGLPTPAQSGGCHWWTPSLAVDQQQIDAGLWPLRFVARAPSPAARWLTRSTMGIRHLA